MVYAQDKPNVLIFDDLTVDNWQVVYDPLNIENHPMIVDKIAKFHALSKVILENDQENHEYRLEFHDDMSAMFAPMTHVIHQLALVVKTWNGFEELGVKLDNFGKNLTAIMFESVRLDHSKEFCVLNHGDFHLRNLMFKRTATGKLSEVLFLDFQMPHQNPPAFDLIGLLTTMADNEVRRKDEEVIKEYHDKLVSYMKLYGFKGALPSLIDIHVGLLRASVYHAFVAIVITPMFMLKGIELGELFAPEPSKEFIDSVQKIFGEPDFVSDMQRSLIKFDFKGVFD